MFVVDSKQAGAVREVAPRARRTPRRVLGRILAVVTLAASALIAQTVSPGPASALDGSLDIQGNINGIPFDRTWAGTVTPAFVDSQDIPVDGVHVVFHDTFVLHSPRDPNSPCDPGSPSESTGALPSWFAQIQRPPFVWPPSGPYAGFNVTTGSTEHRLLQNHCRASTFDQDTIIDLDFVIPASELSRLLTEQGAGCYEFLGENPDIGADVTTTGLPPSLSLGSPGECSGSGTVDLQGFSTFSGTVIDPARAIGTDRAHIDGVPTDALSAVHQLCVESRWTATIKLAVATTTPLFWDGLIHPFPPESGYEIVSTSLPSKKGVFKGLYTEVVTRTKCATAVDVSVAGPQLITGPGKVVSITHSATMWVVSTGLQNIGQVSVPLDATDKKGVLNVDRSTPVLEIPVTY